MIQDVLSNQVIELLQANGVANKVTWPGPIARELVAEVQWHKDELSMQQEATETQAALPLAIENYNRFDSANLGTRITAVVLM
ncbi:MAG: hypothetical protein IPL78_12220 [Chloroflexi bacterium]|nr:hypothetical protein [Chloroflexota bacterium]